MIDFSNAKSIFIPEGEVSIIARGDEILWQKQTKKYNQELLYIESTKRQWIDTGIVPNTTVDYEFTGATTVNNETGWIAGAPTWIGIHEKTGTVAITQTSTGQTYNTVNIGEKFTIGLFGDKAYFNGVETNTIARKTPYQNYTLFLFAYHHTNGMGSINSAIRLYSFKMWDNGTLIRDFIPVLDLNDRPCLFDKVTETLFYNQGTEEFKYAISVDYIQSTGTQFIDTGYSFNSNTDTIEFDYACLETSQYKWIFGNYVGKYLGLSTHSYQTLWYGATSVKFEFDEYNTERHKLIIDENGVSLDGIHYSDFKAFENSVNLYLFAMNYNGTLNTGYKGKAKVWGYKHTRNGKPIIELIPVLDSDGVPCMYDKVSETLFYNKGTGEFKY